MDRDRSRFLHDGAYGTLVPVGDSSRMAEAILDVLSGQLVTVNSTAALERFQNDQVIEQYLAVMDIEVAPKESQLVDSP